MRVDYLDTNLLNKKLVFLSIIYTVSSKRVKKQPRKKKFVKAQKLAQNVNLEFYNCDAGCHEIKKNWGFYPI